MRCVTRLHATSPSVPRRCWRCASVTSASWAGSCTCRLQYAAHVYELLHAAGRQHGIANIGYRAIDTLRMEKGYLYWSTDITPDTTPWEAGLGWRVNMRTGDFCGRSALDAQRQAGVTRKLCTFTLEEMAYPVSGEAILVDETVVGFTTSANFGHTIGKPIAYGYLPVEMADRTEFVIEVYGEPIPATRHDGALYDPTNARLKSAEVEGLRPSSHETECYRAPRAGGRHSVRRDTMRR